MKKAELVSALRDHVRSGKVTAKGEATLTYFLANYFNELEIPDDQNWDFWHIDGHIAQLTLNACEALRTSEEGWIKKARIRYEKEAGQPFPDLSSIQSGRLQALVVQGLGHIFRDATGLDWLPAQIDAVFNAERHLLTQGFYKFVDRVFSKGLFQLIDDDLNQGMSGTFGETTLRSLTISGRLMLTFARAGADSEQTVSFVMTDDDPLGLSSGLQSLHADLRTALDMLAEVADNWPTDRSAQKQVFRADEHVALG